MFTNSAIWRLAVNVLGVFRRPDLNEAFEVRARRAEGVHLRLARAISRFFVEANDDRIYSSERPWNLEQRIHAARIAENNGAVCTAGNVEASACLN